MPIRFFLLLIALLTSGTAFAADYSDLQVRTIKPGATLNVNRVEEEGKVIVSVADAAGNPVPGLSAGDFSVTQSGRKANILSVLQPDSESLGLPRSIVVVLDNSNSMKERRAVDALLSGLDELLKIVRKADKVYIVVFDNFQEEDTDGNGQSVRTFMSNHPGELAEFAAKAYRESITGKTVLYDAIMAGLELASRMPETEPRYMVVFSDGEDLHSIYKREEVLKAAKGTKNLKAYAIDFMPEPSTDRFLSDFASQNSGQVWKAKSANNLVNIFHDVASRMQYYVIRYQFPPTGNLIVAPAALKVDEVRLSNGSPDTVTDASALTLRPVVDSVYGIAKWKVAVTNAKGSVAGLAGEGSPAQMLKVPLTASNMRLISAGGDLAVRMRLEDKKGQVLVMNAPVKVVLTKTNASLKVVPAGLTIEEVRTIDASPMLNHVYFDKGSGEIPARYVRFAGPKETRGFDEQKLRDTLEKYYQVLNIVGKRLNANPDAAITLVGCNDNTGEEEGDRELSTRRAEAVRDYLQTVWHIAPARMTVEARDLPAMPSAVRQKEGQAENRRVEIRSEEPAILAPIQSTYISNRLDSAALTLKPEVVSSQGIAGWRVAVSNSAGKQAEVAGGGTPPKEIRVPLDKWDLGKLSSGGDIAVKMELRDSKGQTFMLSPEPVKVKFIRTSQRLARKEGLHVQEKYALILFDFNKEDIGDMNQDIVERIAARDQALPKATMDIVGHTDSTGKEDYNIKLSERRARAVYYMLTEAYDGDPGDRIHYSGVGPNTPLYDNLSPEARSFNRTVSITLEYLSAE